MNKAFMVFSGYPQDGCELVIAETRNKARAAAVLFDWEYIYINAIRVKEYDKYFDKPRVIESNAELPKGAPPFFSDEFA